MEETTTTELRPLADIERDIKLVRAGLNFADEERAKLFRTVNTWAASTLRKKLWHVVIPDELNNGGNRDTRLKLVEFYLELHHPRQPLLNQLSELLDEFNTVRTAINRERARIEREQKAAAKKERENAESAAAVAPAAD